MDRRTFVKSTFYTSALIGSSITNKMFAANEKPFDLVAVKGGEPDVMLQKGMQALGGFSKFVKKGQKVVIKPNIGWDYPPERASNTNPLLVSEIVKQCKDAGAKEIIVFDHTCDQWEKCYKNSGIEKAVNDAGGKMAPGNSESYYQEVTLSDTKKLLQTKEHELLLESDVFINVPVLKNHGGARLTIAMKNMMGNVWDRRFWHRNDLHQCIADYAKHRKPTLNIVDAYNVMKQNGPRGSSVDDLENMKTLLISTDIVAIDTAAAKVFGMDPQDIPYINIAKDYNIGRMDLENLNIKRISL